MANTFSDGWRERILARMLVHARRKVAVLKSIRTDFDREARRKGETILFKLGVRPTTYTVTPAPTRSAGADVAPGHTPLNLDQWKGAGFRLTRKELGEVLAADVITDTLQNAVEEVVNLVVTDVTDKMKNRTPSSVGAAAQALFQNVATPAQVYEGINVIPEGVGKLAEQEVPIGDQNLTAVLGIREMTDAQQLPSLREADKSGTTRTLREGHLGFVGGANLEWQYYLPSHTAGTQTGAPAVSGAHALGVTSVTMATGAGEALNLNEGDIITFSNDTTTSYVVTADLDVGASSSGSMSIISNRFGRKGGLETALAGSETITIVNTANHRCNLLYHSNFAGLALRGASDLALPGGPIADNLGNSVYTTLQDNEPGVGSGLVLTLATFEEYHQYWIEVSALWGSAVLNPWMGTRLVAAV